MYKNPTDATCMDMTATEISGMCYIYVNTIPMSHEKAQEFCKKEKNGDLAVIDDCYVYEMLVKNLRIRGKIMVHIWIT